MYRVLRMGAWGDWILTHKSTMTAAPEEGATVTGDVVASILKSVYGGSPTAPNTPLDTSLSPPPSSPSISPSLAPSATPPITQHPHHSQKLSIFIASGVLGLALLLGCAWLITRQIRKVRAKLNPHTQGVHRDREREVWEMEGGRGVPEMGDRVQEVGREGKE